MATNASGIPRSLPALTTIWTSPDSCSTHWTYFKASGTYYTYISQDPGTTKDTPCRVPGWGIAQGSFSPGVCPYQWTTWKSQVIDGSITSAMCCPSGYINQNSDCASLYSTTLSSITVYTEYEKLPVISEVPPGTAVLSAVHVLYQESDLSVLPMPTPTTKSAKDTSTSPGASKSGGGVATLSTTVISDGGGQHNNNGGAGGGGGLSTGTIAGIAVGSAVAVILVLIATVLVWRRARQRKAQGDGNGDDGTGTAELHGDEHKAHEIDTAVKPSEVDGSSPAVEMPAAVGQGGNHHGDPSSPPWAYYYDPNTGQWSGPMAAELPGDQLYQHQDAVPPGGQGVTAGQQDTTARP